MKEVYRTRCFSVICSAMAARNDLVWREAAEPGEYLLAEFRLATDADRHAWAANHEVLGYRAALREAKARMRFAPSLNLLF